MFKSYFMFLKNLYNLELLKLGSSHFLYIYLNIFFSMYYSCDIFIF